jgi:nucleoid-associated protein YgaU
MIGSLALACAVIAVGCSENKNSPDAVAANNSVTDITAAPVPAPVATSQQPIIYDTAPAPQVIAVATPTAPSAVGGKYTVQKGDTLWKIATSQYGDGKQWQRIVAANPGLSPETLKAGQTIAIP